MSVALEDIEHKLVASGRGGYCSEHNLLLKAALEALGAEVEVYLARVRWGSSPGEIRGRSHVVLRVRENGESWHADVGFGAGGQLDPLRFGPGPEHAQSGWRFRIVDDGPELVLQTVRDAEWIDLSPDSRTGPADRLADEQLVHLHLSALAVCDGPAREHLPRGRLGIALNSWDDPALAEQTPTTNTVTPVTRAEVPELIAEHFGLRGFKLGANGRITLEDER